MIGAHAPRTLPHSEVASQVAGRRTGLLVAPLVSEFLMGVMALPLRSRLPMCLLGLALRLWTCLVAIHCQPLSLNRTPRGALPARDTPD